MQSVGSRNGVFASAWNALKSYALQRPSECLHSDASPSELFTEKNRIRVIAVFRITESTQTFMRTVW